MKNPFEFAKEILRFTRGELSNEEREKLDAVLSEEEELRALSEELKDKECIRKELQVMEAFDVEKALRNIRRDRSAPGWSLMSWGVAASVVLVVGFTAFFFLNRERGDVMVAMVERSEPGKAEVTLQMASGAILRLDTLSSIIRNDRANIAFDNKDGVLRVKDQEAFADGEKEIGNNTISVPFGGTYTLVLHDGTRVYLNSGTTFEFPSRFRGSERRVKVKGEAYFDVVRDERKPFVVEVDQMAVKVLGTSFDVKSYPDEPGVYTTLVNGRVAIVRQGQPDQVIVPGEQAYYNKGVGTVSVSSVNTEEFTAWKDGLFYFKDMTLEEILRVVARWYDLDVFYINPSTKSVVYSGKLPMYSSVEDVLRKFEISGEVRFELKGRTLTVFTI